MPLHLGGMLIFVDFGASEDAKLVFGAGNLAFVALPAVNTAYYEAALFWNCSCGCPA